MDKGTAWEGVCALDLEMKKKKKKKKKKRKKGLGEEKQQLNSRP